MPKRAEAKREAAATEADRQLENLTAVLNPFHQTVPTLSAIPAAARKLDMERVLSLLTPQFTVTFGKTERMFSSIGAQLLTRTSKTIGQQSQIATHIPEKKALK